MRVTRSVLLSTKTLVLTIVLASCTSTPTTSASPTEQLESIIDDLAAAVPDETARAEAEATLQSLLPVSEQVRAHLGDLPAWTLESCDGAEAFPVTGELSALASADDELGRLARTFARFEEVSERWALSCAEDPFGLGDDELLAERNRAAESLYSAVESWTDWWDDLGLPAIVDPEHSIAASD